MPILELTAKLFTKALFIILKISLSSGSNKLFSKYFWQPLSVFGISSSSHFRILMNTFSRIYTDWMNECVEIDWFHHTRKLLCKFLQPWDTVVILWGAMVEKRMRIKKALNCERKLWGPSLTEQGPGSAKAAVGQWYQETEIPRGPIWPHFVLRHLGAVEEKEEESGLSINRASCAQAIYWK